MVPKWEGRRTELSDEGVGAGVDFHPGGAVLGVGGDGEVLV